MATVIAIVGGAVQVVVLLLASTLVFDLIHYLLHRWMHSSSPLLRALGGLHGWHHRFLDRDLVVHPELTRANLLHHVIPEYLTHVGFTLLLASWLPLPVVVGTLAIQTLVAAYILWQRGQDINHRPIQKLRAYRPMFFCVPEYHALHHVYPDAHFSSWIKPLDWLLRTGTELRRKRVAIPGEETAFRRALAGALERRHARVEDAPSHETDVLVLLDTGPAAHELATGFSEAAKLRKVPPEIWTVSGGPDCAGSASVIHRRLAVAPGEASARDAESLLANVERGFNLVPVRIGLGAALDAIALQRRPARTGS